jgi:hypothetical protein
MSVLRFNMADKVFVLNNLFISMNSVRLVHYESYQRRSPEQKHFGVNLAPIR